MKEIRNRIKTLLMTKKHNCGLETTIKYLENILEEREEIEIWEEYMIMNCRTIYDVDYFYKELMR